MKKKRKKKWLKIVVVTLIVMIKTPLTKINLQGVVKTPQRLTLSHGYN